MKKKNKNKYIWSSVAYVFRYPWFQAVRSTHSLEVPLTRNGVCLVSPQVRMTKLAFNELFNALNSICRQFPASVPPKNDINELRRFYQVSLKLDFIKVLCVVRFMVVII